jgi:ABC-type multidrug transport system fused ATPase/permease subunit
MIAIGLAYLVAGIFGSEFMSFAPNGGVPLVFAKRRHTSSSDSHDVEKSAPSSGHASVLLGRIGQVALQWNQLSVDIGDSHILKNISGYVRQGELTALCGASGAGKTTLLTALSQTNFAGSIVSGQVLVNDQPPSSSYRKTVGMTQSHVGFYGMATNRSP